MVLTKHLASPMRWYDEVYTNGLAIASGSFVLEMVKRQQDGSLVVIAVRQGRGYSVKFAHAIARLHAGAWRLEWKNIPEDFKVPPTNHGITTDKDYYSFIIAKKFLDETAGVYSPETITLEEDGQSPPAS
ncbi:MAG: hypothetical protein WBP93_05320 [Pyrinomonadaceae bacterium]